MDLPVCKVQFRRDDMMKVIVLLGMYVNSDSNKMALPISSYDVCHSLFEDMLLRYTALKWKLGCWFRG